MKNPNRRRRRRPEEKGKRRQRAGERQAFQRKVLKLDGGSCMNICCRRTVDEAHHIIFCSQQGKNQVENGIMLCRECHDKVQGKIPMSITADEFMLHILNQHKDEPHWRWDEAYEYIKDRVERKAQYERIP